METYWHTEEQNTYELPLRRSVRIGNSVQLSPISQNQSTESKKVKSLKYTLTLSHPLKFHFPPLGNVFITITPFQSSPTSSKQTVHQGQSWMSINQA